MKKETLTKGGNRFKYTQDAFVAEVGDQFFLSIRHLSGPSEYDLGHIYTVTKVGIREASAVDSRGSVLRLSKELYHSRSDHWFSANIVGSQYLSYSSAYLLNEDSKTYAQVINAKRHQWDIEASKRQAEAERMYEKMDTQRKVEMLPKAKEALIELLSRLDEMSGSDLDGIFNNAEFRLREADKTKGIDRREK